MKVNKNLHQYHKPLLLPNSIFFLFLFVVFLFDLLIIIILIYSGIDIFRLDHLFKWFISTEKWHIIREIGIFFIFLGSHQCKKKTGMAHNRFANILNSFRSQWEELFEYLKFVDCDHLVFLFFSRNPLQ